MSGENVKNGFRQPDSNNKNAPYFNSKNAVTQSSFAISAGSTNICNVQITRKDDNGVADTEGLPFLLWLSDSSAGLGLTGTSASGTVQAKSASGFDLAALTAKKALLAQPKADGTYTLEITDSAKTGFYIVVQNPFTGQLDISRQLVTGDYG